MLVFGLQCQSLNNDHKATRKDKIGEDCKQRDCQQRAAEAVAYRHENDSRTNLAASKHSYAQRQTLGQRAVAVEEERHHLAYI